MNLNLVHGTYETTLDEPIHHSWTMYCISKVVNCFLKHGFLIGHELVWFTWQGDWCRFCEHQFFMNLMAKFNYGSRPPSNTGVKAPRSLSLRKKARIGSKSAICQWRSFLRALAKGSWTMEWEAGKFVYIPNDSPETNKAVKQLWHQSNMIAIPYSNSQSSSVLNGIGSLRWSATECGPLPQWDTGRHHRSFCEGIQGSLPRMGLARQAGANQFQQKWTSNDDIATYSQKRLVKRIMIPNQLMQLGNIELEVKLSHPLTIFFRIHLRILERLQPCPWIPRGWTIT